MNGPIICGVDDSASAKGAARVARSLSSELGLRVVFVRAIDRKAADADVTAIAERLERLSASANGADCGAAWSLEAGHPADALVDAAKKAQAAMIIVGSTGRARRSWAAFGRGLATCALPSCRRSARGRCNRRRSRDWREVEQPR